jgi:uncharacterized protein (DUF1697 family)
MTSYVALLRGINVGGKTMIPMADLRQLFEAEGLRQVATLLQSGNVLFRSGERNAAVLESRLEKAIAARFSREVDVLIRDEAQWRAILAANPLTGEAKNDPGHLMVQLLKQTPTPAALEALKAAIVGREYFRVGDRCLYLMYPDGSGNSKLTTAVMERKLGMTNTARNWNTAQKIALALAALSKVPA